MMKEIALKFEPQTGCVKLTVPDEYSFYLNKVFLLPGPNNAVYLMTVPQWNELNSTHKRQPQYNNINTGASFTAVHVDLDGKRQITIPSPFVVYGHLMHRKKGYLFVDESDILCLHSGNGILPARMIRGDDLPQDS